MYRKYIKNQIQHPLALKDRGKRILDVLTDVSHLTTEQLAKLLLELNDNAVNIFLQEIRRSISILEGPLVTSRGDGKSYIYANFITTLFNQIPNKFYSLRERFSLFNNRARLLNSD